MILRRRLLAALAVLGSGIAASARAQSSHADTTAVRAVVEALVARIAPEIADVVVHPDSRPWQLVPPDSTDSLWVSAFRGLRELLHTRAPDARDSDVRYLTLRAQPHSDSVRTVEVEIGERWRCPRQPDRWIAGSRSFEIRLVLRDGAWFEVPTGPSIDADPGLCGP